MGGAGVLRAGACLAAFSVGGADAAGGVSIFSLGQEIDNRPWQVFAMYVLVIIVSVFYELLTHHIDHVVTTNSGKAIVGHIYKEVMILGGISLLLTIMENSGGDLLFEPVFFHYVHFVIFFMAINLIVCVSALFLFINRTWHEWYSFEEFIVETETDPRITTGEKQALLRQYIKRYRGGYKMIACMLFFRSNLPSSFKKVSFTRYMKKQQRKELLRFLDLHASAWVALAGCILLVAVQTVIAQKLQDQAVHLPVPTTTLPIPSSSSSGCGGGGGGGSSASGSGSEALFNTGLTEMILFIFVEGYGSLFIIVMCYLKVRRSYNQFADNVEAMRREHKIKPLLPQHYYFWRGNPHLLMQLMQVMLLYQVYYLATVIINLSSRLVEIDGGLALLLVACLPPIFAFIVFIPRIMPKYTILKSVGDLLDHDTLFDIQQADDSSGKFRRIHHRERTIKSPAPFLAADLMPFDEDVEMLEAGERLSGWIQRETSYQSLDDPEPAKDIPPDPPSSPHSPHSTHSPRGKGHRRPDIICEECASHPARVSCGICGILCGTCNQRYHDLRRNREHHIIPLRSTNFFIPQAPLQTDAPLVTSPHSPT